MVCRYGGRLRLSKKGIFVPMEVPRDYVIIKKNKINTNG